MTTKRFGFEMDKNCYKCIADIPNKKLYIDKEEIVDLLNQLNDENEQLKAQLLYEGNDVCGICRHEYLVPSGDYYIAKCKKGHKGCSKENVKYCEDFEKELEE